MQKLFIKRDEADIQILITMLTTVASDPFRPEDKPVHNIFTETVLREIISKEPLEAKTKGDVLMANFVEQ